MVAIHALVEQKFAFLSFYYLTMILAGFYGGRRLLRLLSRSVSDSSVGVARAMRGAAEIIGEYGHYYEIVGEDWDIEALPLPLTVKILAVADAFETLQMATPVRPAFPKWIALEEG